MDNIILYCTIKNIVLLFNEKRVQFNVILSNFAANIPVYLIYDASYHRKMHPSSE